MLLTLAAAHDPGPGRRPPPGRDGRLVTGITLAGQLLPHAVMVVAAVLVLASALFVATPTPAALVASRSGWR